MGWTWEAETVWGGGGGVWAGWGGVCVGKYMGRYTEGPFWT